MKKYAIITNEETKQCDIGLGTNTEYYESIGMTEMEVEQAYNGNWYIKGYAPDKPHNIIIKEKIAELKQNLIDADYWGQKYIDGEYTSEEWEVKKEQRKAWRVKIRELEAQIEPEQTGENSTFDGD